MDKSDKNTIYLVGNAHIDPVWLWQWQEGYAEIKATFRSALDRMNEYEDFIFVCAGASYYKWIEENNPAMFEEIKTRVKEGRWQIVGGWYLQPDCNLPSGESFVRHSLYSQRYYKEKFDKICTTGYNVDSFGHNYMIPQILKKSGMDNYVFMRPGPTEIDIPDPLFYWESPDGSRVLTFRILDNHYNNSFRTIENVIKEATTKDGLNTDNIMLFYGVGNHGGGPTIQALNIIHDLQKDIGDDKLFISSPDEYFSDRRKETLDYPVYNTDIQHHASGCYATHFEFKKQHRKLEQLLLTTERWNTLATLVMDYKDESIKLTEAWETVLFNQFHDIMGGCSLEEALKDAEKALGYAEHLTANVLNGTLQTMSWAIDTSIEGAKCSKEVSGRVWQYGDFGVPLVVFNPLSFAIKSTVFLDLKPAVIKTSDGENVDIQYVEGRYILSKNNPGTIFTADIPALGYTTYWLHMPKEKPEYKPKEKLEQYYTLENEWTKLTIDQTTGNISSLFDKKNKCEFIKSHGAKPLVIDEWDHDTWGHGSDTYDKVIGEFKLSSIELIEDGDVRSTIRVKYEYNDSQLRQDYHLYKHSADIDVDVRVNWQESHKILKLAFDVNAEDPKATYSTPYGHITRNCTGQEEPAQMWMDLSGIQNGKEIGLALACDARYSYSADKNSMRLNVVRSPIFADHDAKDIRTDDLERMDQGIHKLSYKLVPHTDTWHKSQIIQKALILNNPVQKVHETYHKGTLPQTMENVFISNPQIIMTVLKPQEGKGSDSFVVRLYETLGEKATTQIKIPLLNLDTTLDFGAFEIKTLLVDKYGEAQETTMIEMDI